MTERSAEAREFADATRVLVQTHARPLFWRIRFQLLSMLAVMALAVVLPPLLGLKISDVTWTALWNAQALLTFAWAVVASTAGLWILRALIRYPGVSTSPYVLPAMVAAYAAVIFLVFFLRAEYSRYVLGAAFLSGYLWLQIIFYLQDRQEQSLLALVPGGHAEAAQKIRGARWTILATPRDSLSGVAGVVADLRSTLSPQWERFIAQCTLAGVPVYDIKIITETLTGQVDVSHLSETIFGSVLPSNAYLRVKRSVDLVIALVLLPVFLPVIAVTALLIKLESPGPAFFVQPRMGFRAHIFNIYKLRSMRTDGVEVRQVTAGDDPRITRIGRIIRKYRIDEFPQIFNIIRGEMSWIGPRPEPVVLSEWYAQEIPFYIYRHAVRPGISGWAQVNQGHVVGVNEGSEKLRFDFYYIKHFSPFLDMLIVLRTIHTILTGFGSK